MLYYNKEAGQGLVEYALILVLVAVVVIVILSLLGPAIVLCWVLTHRWNRWTVGLTSIILCLLAVLSAVQAGYWRNNETFYRNALRVNPRSVVARHNWGCRLDELGRHDEAAAAYEQSLQREPSNSIARKKLTELYTLLNREPGVALGESTPDSEITEEDEQEESQDGSDEDNST